MVGTTVRLDESTKERLKSLGKMGETYDEVINRILDKYEGLLRDERYAK